VSKKLGCKSVVDNWDGLSVYSVRVVQVGIGSAPGMVTDDDSMALCLDNLESEVVGGACGALDRGSVSKNCSNK
jgi:hypothetical protein